MQDRIVDPSPTWFCLLWASALLLHQVEYQTSFSSVLDSALTLATAWLLTHPRDPHALAAASFFHILAVLQQLPYSPNHWYFAALVSGTILTAYLWELLTQRAGFTAERFFETLAPVVQLNLIVLYFFSGLHKLNSDFLFSEASCVAKDWDHLISIIWVARNRGCRPGVCNLRGRGYGDRAGSPTAPTAD